ncbi:uncharacterized protein LOC120250144 [Dioscorea cayenensis subsp. rotundata]|uniref:Uncharacterized protein LOC120250144 n=1 Tax=Dioscorea cayennensis subsp. rotundata TaxID=55577 RepID=A0AB40AIZ0_DIOCR|nr:uncharacterized protein LOC120250144 [Dioscorea cayenensis subsp. rotundata]
MGASSSTQTSSSSSSNAHQEEESLAASTTPLPLLRAAFSNLSVPSALQRAFSLPAYQTLPPHASFSVPGFFPGILSQIGPSVVDLFFSPSTDDGDIDWLGFLRGYNRCCARASASSSLATLLRLYSMACSKAGIPTKLSFDLDDPIEGKIDGSLGASDLLALLWVCWIMGRLLKVSNGGEIGKGVVVLPDVSHLVISALVACGEIEDDEGIWDFDVAGSEKCVTAQKFCMWVLSTAPNLVHCFSQYVQERVRACASEEGDANSSLPITDNATLRDNIDTYLLTCGRAWAISLTLRNIGGVELLGQCFYGIGSELPDNLLYRSSIHGKGLTRFWSNVEGYHGPLLFLLAASSANTNEGSDSAKKWIIGVLTGQGFENRDTFFGSSGNLYAISPIFRVLSPLGKDKNFIYCRLHPSVRVYEPHPKPVCLAFGGTMGNERIHIDEDFAKITIRHHAVDKTYQHAPLIPNQGFLAVEASVLDVEVWGLGGKAVKDQQDKYKKRETLFSEQRRKVDLKTFASWDDLPEKMMMDMMSDPNTVKREDR